MRNLWPIAFNFHIWLAYYRRLGEVLRRKRYSKRPNRGKAASMAGTSEAHVEVNSHSAGALSSKTLLQESRASFLSSQSSSKSNCRSSGISQRPAKVSNHTRLVVSFVTKIVLAVSWEPSFHQHAESSIPFRRQNWVEFVGFPRVFFPGLSASTSLSQNQHFIWFDVI